LSEITILRLTMKNIIPLVRIGRSARFDPDQVEAWIEKSLGDLLDRTSPRHAERLLNRCLKVDLLILDDFAFRALNHKEAELLYSLAEERGGRASTILTSNRPPQDWYAIFPDPVMGGAILDRLVSAAVKLIVTKGRS
jgi:excisionase family DNA binding protein